MADFRREGLRLQVRLPPQAERVRKQNNERCKVYRQRLKLDPERYDVCHQRTLERNRRNRHRQKTDEEAGRERELARLRMLKYRARKKAEAAAEVLVTGFTQPTPERRATRNEIRKAAETTDAQRSVWAAAKRKLRDKWGPQKWRRHREKNRSSYYTRKADRKTAASTQTEATACVVDLGVSEATACVVEEQGPLPAGEEQHPHCLSSPRMKNDVGLADSCPCLENDFEESSPCLENDFEENSPCLENDFEENLPSRTPMKGKERTPAALRKAVYRKKKVLFGSTTSPTVLRKVVTGLSQQKDKLHPDAASPLSANIKTSLYRKLGQLCKKRDKKSLASRKLLLETISPTSASRIRSSPYKRKKQNPKTNAAVKFLVDVSVDLPGKKTVDKETHQQKKVLPRRLRRLHKEFNKSNPGCKVGLRTMYRRKPSHVKTVHQKAYRQCLCGVCENIDLKLDALNLNLSEPIDGGDILSDFSLCSPEPSLQCYERKCNACGTEQVRGKIQSLLKCCSDIQVSWFSWELVKKEKGSRKEKVAQKTSLQALIEQLLLELKTFPMHVFTYRWQHKEYKALLAKLPSLQEKVGVVVCDFAENHLCKYQDEVQSAHWGYNQVTVHPCVLYHACPNGCNELITHYYVYLSDDLQHDAHMVDAILRQTKKDAEELGLSKLVIWSDGCAAQYKSKLPFHYVSRDQANERAFFGSCHGKGPCDACGGVVKRIIDDDVRSGEVIVQSAEEMYQHLNKNYRMPEDIPAEGCSHTYRSFKVLKTEEIDRTLPSAALLTLPGTRQIHSMRGEGHNSIKTRHFSCFCDACMGLPGQSACQSAGFAGDWEKKTIRYTKSWMQENCAADSDSDTSVSSLSPQDSPSPVPNTAPLSPPPISPPLLQENCPPTSAASREGFFHSLQQKMEAANSVLDLEELCSSVVHHFPVPINTFSLSTTRGLSVDVASIQLLPKNAPHHHLPIETIGDGNCFPRSLSTLVCGHQDLHRELRVRLVLEMVCNKGIYIDPHFIGNGVVDDGNRILAGLKHYSDTPYDEQASLSEVLLAEAFRTRKMGQECGMWHVFAAASVLGTPVSSLFPEMGQPDMRNLANRTVYPVGSTQTAQARFILWTTHRKDQRQEYWAPTHFVPLLPLHPESNLPVIVVDEAESTLNRAFVDLESTSPSADKESLDMAFVDFASKTPLVDGFYLFTWQDKKQYVCQVKQLVLDEELVHISFMANHGPCVYWATVPDESWEDISSFIASSERLELFLDETRSTQRKQVYCYSKC